MNEELCDKCGCPVHPCLPCGEVVMLQGNNTDYEYCRLLENILEFGKRKKNRTGVDTIGIFGEQAKFEVSMDAFPILTTKKVWFKGIVHELLWFLRGDTNIKYLVDNGVHIWDEWAYKRYADSFCSEAKDNAAEMIPTQEQYINMILTDSDFAYKCGDLGEGTYGGMWRDFPHFKKTYASPPEMCGVGDEYEPDGVDQIQKVMDKLRTNPDDRRMIVSAWHPYWVDHCALPPCHCLFHFNTEELTFDERAQLYAQIHCPKEGIGVMPPEPMEKYFDEMKVPKRRLNLLLYQRSCDTFLGVPFNITSYSLLLAMVAHCSNMVPGVFTHTYGDLHIYENHMEQVKEQLHRTPMKLPKLWLNPDKIDLRLFDYNDIKLVDYKSHPAIKAPIAI